MIVLAIHSTTPCLAAALIRDGEVLVEDVRAPGREHVENLALMIKGLTESSGVALGDLAGLGVAVGPGSFSGIRVGLATAKGMALALGKPVAGVSSLEILAREALNEGETAAAVIDARRGEIYTALYKREADGLDIIDGPVLMAARDLGLLKWPGSARLVICGDSVTAHLAAASGLPLRTLSGCSASGCGILAWERLRRGEEDGVHGLVPLYVRRSDAEEKREGLKGRK